MRETALYAPIKAYLEGQGYSVKSEIQGCDVVACRQAEPPVIVELKLALSMALLLQGVDRQAVTDAVYIAVPFRSGARFRASLKDATKLCRRLGLGLLTVRMETGLVQAQCDPGPYQPRKVARRKVALLREFERRVGDPNEGGQTRRKIVTAYRQDALRLAQHLSEHGPASPAALRDALGVAKAASILQKDHYGWFERIERGVYGLRPEGRKALETYADIVQSLNAA